MSVSRSVLGYVGSLWFAAVLLVLLLVAMACATVVESTHGAERALVEFYHSWWFAGLLGLVGLNVLSALVLRFPFNRRQIGFVLAHGGILVTLLGAFITERLGVNGRVGFSEGETDEYFILPDRYALTVTDSKTQAEAAIDLEGGVFGGLEPVDQPKAPPLTLADLHVEVERYLPDSEWTRSVTEDNDHPHPAVEASLSASGQDEVAWLFAGRAATLGPVEAVFKVAADAAELEGLLTPPSAGAGASRGTVRVEYRGNVFEFPLEAAQGEAVPLGDTGYTARVVRYLPHAKVENKQLVSVSDQPVNPAVEVELAGPAGTDRRYAFARFPEFEAMHRKRAGMEDFKLAFAHNEQEVAGAAVEVIGGPKGELYARFTPQAGEAVVNELTVGVPVETPWPGRRFAVLSRFENARVSWALEPVERDSDARIPALLVDVTGRDESQRVWVRKYDPRSVVVGGTPYELRFGDKNVPLGFALTLNKFHIGYYPGTQRPRSFESHVTIADPASGREQNRIISMNQPTKHGGYALFQASYSLAGGDRTSILSVSRDPGLPVVYTGYVAMMAGMVVVLITRALDRRQTGRSWAISTTTVEPPRRQERQGRQADPG